MNPTSLIPTESANLFFPLILLLLPFLFILLLTHHTSTKKQPPLPPGPSPWPIIGNLFQLGKTPLHISLANLAKVHGPLMLLKMGSLPIIVGSSPEAAREILKTHDRSLSGRSITHTIRFKGSKLHNLQLALNDECDDKWRRVKSIYKSELFSAKVLESQMEIRERKIRELVRYLGSMKDGRVVVKIKEVVTFTAINVISYALVSRDFVDLEGRGVGEGLMENVRRFAESAAKPQLGDMFGGVLSWWDLQGTYKELMGIFGRICGIWVGMVEEKKGRQDGALGGRDFADALIQSEFSDDQINALFVVGPPLSLSLSPHACMIMSSQFFMYYFVRA